MVWKILNPFVGAGMVGFHLLFWLDFLNFGTLKRRDNHPIWLAHYCSNGLVKKPPALGCVLLLGVVFCFIFCPFVEGELPGQCFPAPDFDRRHPSGTMVGKLLGCFFLSRGFEHHLLSLIFPQRTGFGLSKKWDGGKKKSGRTCGRRNFRPKNNKLMPEWIK